jgi:3-hydroxybutyryl-CoA dehydrogenase
MTALAPDSIVAVIGAGTMGAGIALVAARAGHKVLLHDAVPGAIDRGIDGLIRILDGQVAKGKLDPAERDSWIARIRPAETIEALAPSSLVIEAIVENIDIKATLLAAVEAIVGNDAIITSNTSSLSITALAARLARADRIAGMHFFNPAPALPLVEVVAGHATDPTVLDVIAATALAWGKVPVRCKSTPGFIVNRVARPFYGEAWRLLSEGAADAATIDAVLKEAGGFRMGPFTLMDMIGHDVNFAVTRSVYEAMFHDPRYRPSLAQQQLVDAGWLGRKSGLGIFDYREGAARPDPSTAKAGQSPSRVVVEGDLGPARELIHLMREAGLKVEEQTLGDDVGGFRLGEARLVLTDGRTATQRAISEGNPVICFDLCRDWRAASRVAMAASDDCPDSGIAAASGLFQTLGKQVSIIEDSPGLITFRTLAMIINEALDALHQQVATASDIDLSMTKGVNYPQGPLAWCDAIGARHVAAVIGNLAATYGEDRYRPSPLLTRAALTNKPFIAPSA